jgi:hypothetical protein
MVGPLFLSVESRRLGTHDTKPHQQPSSASQASFDLDYSDLPILAKLPSALFNLEQLIEFYLAPIECEMALTESHQVLKILIGAPIRCSLRLSYQISPGIDLGVKFCCCFECRLLFLLLFDLGIRDEILYILIIISSIMNRWN